MVHLVFFPFVEKVFLKYTIWGKKTAPGVAELRGQEQSEGQVQRHSWALCCVSVLHQLTKLLPGVGWGLW